MALTTKASRIRSIIKEIGADRQNPPSDWRQKVEATLKKEGIKAHIVTIYQQRSLLLNGSKKAKKQAEAPNAPVTVQQVLVIKSVVKQLGSLSSVKSAIEVYEAIATN